MTTSQGNIIEGDGWTLISDPSRLGGPGVRDIGHCLGAKDTEMVLVGLRAADRWTPVRASQARESVVLRRAGRLQAELGDGSTRLLDGGSPFLSTELPLLGLVNCGTELAEAFVIVPRSRDGRTGRCGTAREPTERHGDCDA